MFGSHITVQVASVRIAGGGELAFQGSCRALNSAWPWGGPREHGFLTELHLVKPWCPWFPSFFFSQFIYSHQRRWLSSWTLMSWELYPSLWEGSLLKHRLKTNFFFKWRIVDLQVVLIFIVQQCHSVIHTYILFHILFHYGLSRDIEYNSLCYN